ncbi:MAG: efflux RND transporter permease subunit [Xanthomonadales bacterium]|nr:efflux RND transporter permease subunit [Xanthomonadales bacterium]
MNLAERSLKRPVTAVMFYVSLVVIGIIAAFRLPLEQFPDVNVPFIFVSLPYPGSTPQEVDRTITRPAEEALSTLPGISRMGANSRPDGSQVFIQFKDWDRDIELTASEARERIDAIRGELPDDLQRYFVFKFSPSDQPVLRVRFAGDRNMVGEYNLIDRLMKRRIERVPGVAKVEISGAPPPEVEIAIIPSRLGAHGVALNELASRLQTLNFSVSAGDIDDGNRRIRVQPIGELRSLDELRELVINDTGLRLGDIASVRLKNQAVDFGRRLDGKVAVGLDIFRDRTSNLVDVSHNVLAEVEQIMALPDFEGVQVKIISDQAESVSSSISELIHAGVVGACLSVFVLFYFLRHWPSTFMVTLAIPLCIVMTLGGMYFMGMTLNILTMMGLLLGIGMLVDNAVVVVESIYQYREKWPDDPVRCAIEGTRGVQLAISAGTLTSIIVFAPNIFGARNFISIYLGQVAITITIALLASWIVAVSLIPMISARLQTPKNLGVKTGLIPRMTEAYARLLRWTLAHRGWTVLGMMLVIAVSMIPASFTKFDMFQDNAGRELEFYYQWKGAYSLDTISEEVRRVEEFIDANREKYQVVQIYSWFSEQGWAGTRVKLRDPNPSLWDRLMMRNHEADLLSSEQVREMLREEIPASARAEIGFNGDGGGGGGGGGDDKGIQVFLNGDSSEVLADLAESSLIPILSTRKELRDVRVDTGDANSELTVQVDRERAAAFGFSAQEVARYIGIALRGSPLREFRQGDSEIPVWVRFAGSEQFRVEDLSALNLRRADGTDVPLMSIIKVEVRKGATQISRNNRQISLVLKADLAPEKSTEDARKAIEEVLGGVTLPDGYKWSLGGNFERNDEAGAQMAFNTLIALCLVYIVMAALFESLLMPAAIITSIFFSALGVFWLFALTGTTFTIMASIGILVLMGVVVNNGIVMFEHINNLRREGYNRVDSLVEGSRERFRPILMTMGTTILGMMPLCVGGTQMGGDGPAYFPMARAIAGGLAFSTLVSLIFLPTIYALLDDLRLGTGRLMGRAVRVPFGWFARGTAVD